MKKTRQKNNSGLSRIWPYIAIIIGLVGVILILFGKIYEEKGLIPKILTDIGIALFVGAIVALLLDRLVHEAILRKVNAACESLKTGSDVLAGASELGIEDIFSRNHPSGRKRWELKMQSALKKELSAPDGSIKIACVAAPELFHRGRQAGELLWECMMNKAYSCSLQVLMLCPHSEWARERAALEPEHPTVDDIRSSILYLNHLKKFAGNRVQLQCYSFPPIAFLIITQDSCFIEAYPMTAGSRGEGGTGGKTPMLIARKDTETYIRWNSHFDHIWNHKKCSHVSETSPELQQT